MIKTYDGRRYIAGEYDTNDLELLEKAFDPTGDDQIQDGCCGCEFIPEEIAVVLHRNGLRVVPDNAREG